MKKEAFALVVSILAAACAGTPAQTRTEPDLDRLAAAFQAAYNRGDAVSVASFYAEDAVTMPPNRPMVRGRTAIAASLHRNLDDDPATMLMTRSSLRLGAIARTRSARA